MPVERRLACPWTEPPDLMRVVAGIALTLTAASPRTLVERGSVHTKCPWPVQPTAALRIRGWHSVQRSNPVESPQDRTTPVVRCPALEDRGCSRSPNPFQRRNRPRRPSPRIGNRVFRLAPGRPSDAASAARLVIASTQTTGRASGGWLVNNVREQLEVELKASDAGTYCTAKVNSPSCGERRIRRRQGPLRSPVNASHLPEACCAPCRDA
jgi:hypothetical protein